MALYVGMATQVQSNIQNKDEDADRCLNLGTGIDNNMPIFA